MFTVETMQMLPIFIYFIERWVWLVGEENTLIKDNWDFSKAFCLFSNDSPAHNVVKCRLFYGIAKGWEVWSGAL